MAILEPYPHVYPILVVENYQYKFKLSRPSEIFEEMLKKIL